MRLIAALCSFLLLQSFLLMGWASPALADPVNMDLGSTSRNVSAAEMGLNSPVTIRVGGALTTVHPESMITPAEFAAVSQILSSGAQTLQVGAAGAATGGR